MAVHPAQTACRQNIIGRSKSIGNGDNDIQPRLEIDTFCQDARRLNLYLLALEALQVNTNLNDLWCYFRLSAIHGLPPMDYNGCSTETLYEVLAAENRIDEMTDAMQNDVTKRHGFAQKGFCVHGSVLFPSWHRAYILAIEQAVQAKMYEIALQFQDPIEQGLYVKVANQFRYPYWDMLRPRRYENNIAHVGISYIFCVKRIRVMRPPLGLVMQPLVGTPWAIIDNPLYQYTYPTQAQIDGATLNIAAHSQDFLTGDPAGAMGVKHTCRCAKLPTGMPLDATSDHVVVQRSLLLRANPNNFPVTGRDYVPESAYDIDSFRRAGIRAKLYASLTQTLDADPGMAYAAFATRSLVPALSNTVDFNTMLHRSPRSLESLHDDMHSALAGQGVKDSNNKSLWGTMSPPQMASYDPIFHNFHTGIDMYYSLFLAAHPDWRWTKKNKLYLVEVNYAEDSGTQETPYTPLMPFRIPPTSYGWFSWKPYQQFLNTNDLYKDKDWNYHYDLLPPNATKEQAIEIINKNYLWLKPTSLHMSDYVVVNAADQNYARNRVQSLEHVPAFVPNPNGALWPPWIDDQLAPIELHPPPAAPVNANVATFLGVKSSKPLEQHSLSAKNTVTRTAIAKPASIALSTKLHEDPDQPIQSTKVENPQFLYDPPHPDQLYYNLPNHIVKANREIQNWSFQVRYERMGINSGFTVYVFVGDFPTESRFWADCPNLVHRAHNFATPEPDRINANYSGPGDDPNRTPKGAIGASCGNCAEQAEAGVLVGDWVPLTPILLDYVLDGRIASTLVPEADAKLHSLEQEDVVPFLKRHLHWRIIRDDGIEIHRSDIPQFVAWVHDEVMLLPRRWDELPEYHDYAIQWDITDGRPGGLNKGDRP